MAGKGKGGRGGNGGKGGKGGKGQAVNAAVAAPSTAEGLSTANARFVKAFADNTEAYPVFDHEKLDGQICSDVRDLARRLNTKGWDPFM